MRSETDNRRLTRSWSGPLKSAAAQSHAVSLEIELISPSAQSNGLKPCPCLQTSANQIAQALESRSQPTKGGTETVSVFVGIDG